ncbi:MAG: hypothetical protein HZB48_01640 [Actinobacteria bacterium]|nr:hypothetical protein [Actinomycetota bacterium]
MPMASEPIDFTRIALRTLRALDDGRRTVEKQWREWTSPARPDDAQPPSDRRQPPDIW